MCYFRFLTHLNTGDNALGYMCTVSLCFPTTSLVGTEVFNLRFLLNRQTFEFVMQKIMHIVHGDTFPTLKALDIVNLVHFPA